MYWDVQLPSRYPEGIFSSWNSSCLQLLTKWKAGSHPPSIHPEPEPLSSANWLLPAWSPPRRSASWGPAAGKTPAPVGQCPSASTLSLNFILIFIKRKEKNPPPPLVVQLAICTQLFYLSSQYCRLLRLLDSKYIKLQSHSHVLYGLCSFPEDKFSSLMYFLLLKAYKQIWGLPGSTQAMWSKLMNIVQIFQHLKFIEA